MIKPSKEWPKADYVKADPEDCCTPERQLEIHEEMQDLKRNINHLEERLNILGNRLTPILTEPTPCGETNQKDKGSRTALGEDLKIASYQVREIRRYIDSMIDRLEI